METPTEEIHQLAEGAGRILEEAHSARLKGQAQVCCTLPKEVLEEFMDRVARAYYPRGLDEAVEGLMRKALLEAGPKSKPEQSFVKHRYFDIPRRCFILTMLPGAEHKKLEEWNRRHDDVVVGTGSKGEVWIMNESELAKWRQQQQRTQRPLESRGA
jgi:hypothetical protein